MKIKTYLILVLTALSFQLNAQISSNLQPKENDPLLKKAVMEYEQLHYVSAIDLFLQFKKKFPYYLPATEMLANSYRQIKDYKNSLHWYEQLCAEDEIKADWALYYAEALANNEQYEQSEQWYRKYLGMIPSDRRAQAFAKMNLQNVSKNPNGYKVKYTNINNNASDYSPIYYKKGLLFSSNRKESAGPLFKWDNTSFSDLYVIDDLESIQASATAEVSKPLEVHKAPGNVNSSYHEGAAVLLPEGSLMFTRNNYSGGRTRTSSDGINKLKLFTAGGKNWTDIEEFPYNSNEYSVGHPAISPKGDILIFASDKPGGFGGTDLYYSVRIGPEKLWGKPVNMGPKINTEGNEMFPYWDKDHTLYFSSTGHAGLGGLDIFEVKLKDLKPQYPPKNLGMPINSAADDFGLINNKDGSKGFFSSNRAGNDHILSFEKKDYTIMLEGLVIDASTKRPIASSTVDIRSSEGALTMVNTDQYGKFSMELKRETEYDFLAQKSSYLNNGTNLSTSGVEEDKTFNVVIELNKPKTDQQWVLDHCDSLKRLFQVQNIYYDLDKSNIRPDARPALDQLFELMMAHPEISINTASHTDTRATVAYNTKLSQRRGQSVKSYLVDRGIAASRVLVQFYGKSHLVNNCNEQPCTEAMQQLNRRTEFEIIINGVNLSKINCK